MKNSVVVAHCQYLTELVSGRNLSELLSGYKVSHAFNPGECSASTALLQPGFHHLISQSFQAEGSFLFSIVSCAISDLLLTITTNEKIVGNKKVGICIFSLCKRH